jgi:hypothetical protein
MSKALLHSPEQNLGEATSPKLSKVQSGSNLVSKALQSPEQNKKDVHPMKILAQISAVEVKFKQSLTKEKKIEVVHGCTGNNYAQIIVVTDKVSQIKSKQNAAALELCKAMKQVWRIKGHNDDNKEDNNVNNDIVGLETSLGTVKDK